MDKSDYEMIWCIVNAGFSGVVMDAAKEVGAKGGTVFHAKGTANKEAEAYFRITVQPEKDVVMLIVPRTIKDAVLAAAYKAAGPKTSAQGITFSLPVSDTAGLNCETAQAQPQETAGDSAEKVNQKPAKNSAGNYRAE